MWRYIVLCYINLILIGNFDCARILAVYPVPSKSHQFVFRSFTKALAERGHELVVVSPDPFSEDERPKNVTNIDTSETYAAMAKVFPSKSARHGVILDIDAVLEMDLYVGFVQLIADQMNYPAVQTLINDKNQKFDLIIIEGFCDYPLIFSHIFKAPVILFSSFMGFAEHVEMLGGIARHPILYPHLHRRDHNNLNLLQWAKELYYEYQMYRMFVRRAEKTDVLLKENFGPHAPTVVELQNNVDMVLLNSYPEFSNNRPVPPNIIYLGAVHLQPQKDIPKDLKTYLDSSRRGVIYVSFGSNVRPSKMTKEYLNEIVRALGNLPYEVLWKFDGDSLENMPKNVKYQKWFPQRDMLFHPNIKVFVTQCGLQSTDEAIDAGVPLVGIPIAAEQWYNAKKYVDFGIGVKLESYTLTADDLVKAVKTVAENKSYKENVIRLKRILQDQTQTPLERAVWWTEYAIRHTGASHLRNPGAGWPWYKYYMLDILLPLLGIFITGLLLAGAALNFAYQKLVGIRKRKDKRL